MVVVVVVAVLGAYRVPLSSVHASHIPRVIELMTTTAAAPMTKGEYVVE